MLNRHRKQKNAQGVRRKKKSECTDWARGAGRNPRWIV
jgi:hypothetical protein